MKILHTGDIHLDSPFAGLPAKEAEARRRDVRETFSAMMKYAGDNGVDMVIIAGDLFESGFATRETVARLRRDFSSLSCPVIITPGNHDPADEAGIWKKNLFPDNVFVFTSPELSVFSFDDLNCDVYGWGFSSSVMTKTPLMGQLPEDEKKINILAGHCDTMSPVGNYCPTPTAALRAFGADYCALAHIHNPENANTALTGIGAYCGCPEGRDFGECGPKGAILAEVEKKHHSCRFVRFSKRIYRKETLNTDGAADYSEIESLVTDFCERENISDDTLLRITLTGRVSPSLVIDTDSLAENIRGPFYTEIKDETCPMWDGTDLVSDRGIKGEVYRQLLPRLESADPDERESANRALRYALAALAGENISDM